MPPFLAWFALRGVFGVVGTLRSLALLAVAAFALRMGLFDAFLSQFGVPPWAPWAIVAVAAATLAWRLVLQLLPIVVVVALFWSHIPFTKDLPRPSFDGVADVVPQPLADFLASPESPAQVVVPDWAMRLAPLLTPSPSLTTTPGTQDPA
jgi:hypothetical protein